MKKNKVKIFSASEKTGIVSGAKFIVSVRSNLDFYINVTFWCTDNFSAYNILPNQKHIVGKIYTQRIERENLTLRNRLKD